MLAAAADQADGVAWSPGLGCEQPEPMERERAARAHRKSFDETRVRESAQCVRRQSFSGSV